MNFFLNNPFLFALLFSFTSSLYSQERTITGFVTTLDNIPVVNAEVKVLSSKIAVLTDTVGYFNVSCLFKDKIKIDAKGFNSQKVKIHEETKELFINLMFKPSKKNINVAVEFGHIKEKDKTFAISTIRNNKGNRFSRFLNMYALIGAISPSVVVNGKLIIIRGESSLNGGNQALIVIDGIVVHPSQLDMLSPLDVKSIDILDGASSAMYGVRGANGVVVIITKREVD